MIVKCTCKHEFQDKLYGKQRRVANRTEKEDTARCTVCGAEHNVPKRRRDE